MKKPIVACVLSNCSAVCAILTVVSLISPVWATTTVHVVWDTIGLFEECTPKGCIKYKESSEFAFMKVTQAFLVIATILLAVNGVVCIIVALKNDFASAILFFFTASAICSLIAMAVFTGKEPFTESGASYGYSYEIGWAAFALNLVCVLASLALVKAASDSGPVYSAMA